jgi:hypothetical protein
MPATNVGAQKEISPHPRIKPRSQDNKFNNLPIELSSFTGKRNVTHKSIDLLEIDRGDSEGICDDGAPLSDPGIGPPGSPSGRGGANMFGCGCGVD